MLSIGQINLLVHLKRFSVANQATCLLVLDTDNTRDKEKLLYSLRPLVKNGYISQRKDRLYGLLHKGMELVSHIKPILTIGGTFDSRRRISEVSHMAALLGRYGIPTHTEIPPEGRNCFIPSAKWRKLREGLLSTTRFLGILFCDNHRLAVYHIGDGEYEWQLRAECSLHYQRYNGGGTHLTGILLVCGDGLAVDIGKRIVRRTLWERNTLLERAIDSKTGPVRYARVPIRARVDYKHVYLAEEAEIMDVLRIAGQDDAMLEAFSQELGGHIGGRDDRKFIVVDKECHYFCLSRDLLHLAYFYKDMKDSIEHLTSGRVAGVDVSEYKYHLYLPKRFAEWGSFLKLPVIVNTIREGLY
jgi:hypothetical protein